MIKDIFDKMVVEELINRINSLQSSTQKQWGKMSTDQMLAHCNVPYIFTYEPEKFKKPSTIKKFFLKTFVKKYVVSERPYRQNSRTSREFIINNSRKFEHEKSILIENILKTQKLGAQYFEGKENFSFGKMTQVEWNNMFYKHLDHHLKQFDV